MMNQLSGKERKETGQQLVLSVDVAWKEHAMAELEKYCEAMKEAGKDEFVFEDFRRHCQGLMVGEPHHPNAWGSLATCAAKMAFSKEQTLAFAVENAFPAPPSLGNAAAF